MKTVTHLATLALTVLMTVALGAPAAAQDRWWGGDDTYGGDGTWTRTSQNWGTSDEAPWSGSTAHGSSYNAHFAGAGGTVTISGDRVFHRGLWFNAPGYTVTGGTLTRSDSDVVLAGTAQGTVNTYYDLAGGRRVRKWDDNTIMFNGTTNRGVNVESGTIIAGENARLGVTTVFDGGTLVLNSGSDGNLLTSDDSWPRTPRPFEVRNGATLASSNPDGVSILGITLSNAHGTLNFGHPEYTHGITVTPDIASSYARTLNVAADTTVTFSGNLSGSGSYAKEGLGTVILSGDNAYTGGTTVNAGTLLVNGELSGTSGVTVESGAVLGGYGTIHATIGGAGTVAPGSSPGILTAVSLDPTAGMGFAVELTQTGSPDYSSPDDSKNDVLHLTGAMPVSAFLTSDNAFDVYLGVASLGLGDAFRGGAFIGVDEDFLDAVEAATFSYYVLGDGSGTHAFGGMNYYSLAEYNPAYSVALSTVAETANFGGGDISGRVMQWTVVPEPSSAALLALAGLAMLMIRRRK